METTHFVLCEGSPPPRGFLSNYVTILLALRELLEFRKVSEENIWVSPTMFTLYGDPNNWFAPDRLQPPPTTEARIDFSTKDVWLDYNTRFDFTRDVWRDTAERSDVRHHPFSGLLPYKKLFDYNERIARYLRENVTVFDRCLGVHFRGTDNNYGKATRNHAKPVPLSVFLERVSTALGSKQYEHLFVATDECGIVEQIEEHCWTEHKFDQVHYNSCIRSATGAALHKTSHDPETKIKLGDEILLDVHCLAGCRDIICKASNIVSYLGILDQNISFLRVDW